MPIRIYALAKELQIDNKKLVDICTRAGIMGKGSALASLTDEEMVRVKSIIDGMKGGGRSDATGGRIPEGGQRGIRREDYIAPAGSASTSKVPVMPAKPEKPAPMRKKAEEPIAAPAASAPSTVPVSPKAAGSDPLVAAPSAPLSAVTSAPANGDATRSKGVPSMASGALSAKGKKPSADDLSKQGEVASTEPTQAAPTPALTEKRPAATIGAASAKPSASPLSAKMASGPVGSAPMTRPPQSTARPGPVPMMPTRSTMSPSARPLAGKLGKRSNDQSESDRTAGDKGVGEKGNAERKPGDKRPQDRQTTTMHLAPMPVANKSQLKSKSKEPAPQKPDIKLPPDAIRAGKAGSKPLGEHLRKQEERKRDDLAAKKGPPRKPSPLGEVPLVPPDPALAGKDRSRRGGAKTTAVLDEEGDGPTNLSALGGREQRQLKRKKSATVKRADGSRDDDEGFGSGGSTARRMQLKRQGGHTAAPRKGKVTIELPCTVRSFSEATGVRNNLVLGKLLGLGIMANINSTLDYDMIENLSIELGVEIEIRQEQALEDRVLESVEQIDAPESLEPRPPIVTVLGHVDHGKTSLLDRIIGLDVAAHEKGGITQHIRAYKIMKDGHAITFVDTPGHEAFTEMRARGANVTDIAVLVVAADDGVMPQTEEAISHAKAAGVPIVIALNKIDLPGVNIDRIYQQLAQNELLPSEWGGETELVKTSAITGAGIDDLLETLLTVAELHEFKANPNRPAFGTCLEAEMNEDRGVIAKLLVQSGTLKPGDVVVCGAGYGRVKAMYDTLDGHKKHPTAGPSTPVNVTGLSVAPGAGDRFHVVPDISDARALAEQRFDVARQRELTGGGREHVTLETLFERLGKMNEQQTLNIILRADVRGSIEAIKKELQKLEHPEVQIRILQATVGGITEADVHLADASDAVIIGFSVVPDEGARLLADARGVQVRRYDIIYQVTEDLKAALEGMLKPEKREKDLGRALVQQVFDISRLGKIAGCRVLSGSVTRDSRMRVIRESRIIGEYAVETLRREKDDSREVREGMECGIKLANFNDIKAGDVLEAYKVEEVKRTFADSAAT